MTTSTILVGIAVLVLLGIVIKVVGSLIRLAVTGAMIVLGIGVFLWARAQHPEALSVFGDDPWTQAGGLIIAGLVALLVMDLLVGGRSED